MRCGHCKTDGVDRAHVRGCAGLVPVAAERDAEVSFDFLQLAIDQAAADADAAELLAELGRPGIPTPADAARRAARVIAGNGGKVATAGGPPAAPRPTHAATEKQLAFLRRLANERAADELAEDRRTIVEAIGEDVLDATLADLDKAAASKLIDAWLKLPTAPPVTCDEGPSHHTAAGSDHLARGRVHVLEIDGRPTYVRVHVSQRTGKPYAATANLEHGLEWEYAPGLVRRLRPATLVTPEQAKEFGDLTERCVFCSTPIDTPESTAVGYGPVCAEKNGLPWG